MGRTVPTVPWVVGISPPFTIEEYPVSADDGLCLVGLACLRVATNDKDELKAIFTSFDSGLTSSALFNFTCCKGLVMDLLQALSRDVGFDFETYVVADDKDGSSDRSSGSWDGIIKDIRSGAAQMAFASLSVTQARKGVVDFSSPFYYTKFSFLVAATKTKVNLSAFLEPFSWKLWIAIFSALHATAIAAAIFEWISPFGLNPRGRMRSKNFTLASALTTVYSLFFSHVMAFKAPKSWPNKVLINFWGGFCFVILASYTANHAAIYAGFKQPSFENIFDNEDLLSRKVTTIRGSSAEIFVRNINPALHQHMTSNQYFNVVSVEDAVEKLKRGSLDAFIYDTAILSYVQATDAGCTLRTAGASFGSQGYAVALPIGSSLKSAVSTAILKYMESGFMDDIRTKWLTGLSCQMDDSFSSMNQPRALGLEDFAGVFLLLAVGGAVGFLILLLEHLVYRCLPRLRMLPKTSLWHSRHIMFFSQKLYRFINSVDLVSPNSSAKEFASSVKQGQFIGMFQKSVKKRAKEEALQQKRARNADNFFETIHELTRNLREGSSMDIIDNEEALSNGRLPRPQSRSKNGSSPSNNPPMERVADVAEEVMRRSPIRRLNRQPNIGDSLDNVHSTTRSFSDFQNALQDIKSLPKAATSLSLKDNCLPSSRNNVWVAQAAEDGTMYNGFPSMDSDEEDDDTPSPSTPLCAPQPPSKGQRLSLEHDRLPPYTSLRGLDNVDIDEVSKQDLLNMWQLAESDLRLQIRQLAREKAQLVKQVSSASVKKSNTPTDL
ncbi:hypothetical protein RvY_10739-2 [Ramazzottius varieornatus]|uniref:Ionotropic glutamate receptor C-terminal domain-containing protein n=1 Tax=Ramazzottius varieornatus TaxID=947166 RepID=A0A1D1VDS8_RAMVA|nr:hypothetical protein RvY_10739-2 [Ramazzottius varieornatus]